MDDTISSQGLYGPCQRCYEAEERLPTATFLQLLSELPEALAEQGIVRKKPNGAMAFLIRRGDKRQLYKCKTLREMAGGYPPPWSSMINRDRREMSWH